MWITVGEKSECEQMLVVNKNREHFSGHIKFGNAKTQNNTMQKCKVWEDDVGTYKSILLGT